MSSNSNKPRNRANRPLNVRPENPAHQKETHPATSPETLPSGESGRPTPTLSQSGPGIRVPAGPVVEATPQLTTPAAPASATRTTPPATARARRSAPPPPKNNALPIIIVTGIIVVGLAAFIAFLLLGKPSLPATQPSAQVASTTGDIPVGVDAAAQVKTFANQGQNHFATGQSIQTVNQSYNSDPPNSGPHWPNWSNWGVFQQAIPSEMQVHNLEHGGIVIQYDCPQGCPQAVNTLSSYAFRYPATNFTGVLLAPRPNLPEGARIALTAWTHRLLLKTVDTDKINQFVAAYIGKGPEQDPNFRP
jgi:hypothetical protein